MEMHDAWFFLGVFVFIFLIWIATGGPLHPIAFTGPTLAGPGALGGGTYLSLPSTSFGLGSSNVSLPGSSNGVSVPGNSGTPLPTFVGGSVFGDPSPYRGIVSMNHYVSGTGSDQKKEYIEIYVPQNAGVPVDLSGWTFSSDASGSSAGIPQGTEVPTSGVVNASQNIILSPGERAIVISGQSPIGSSFRENKCMGYFSTFQSFYPSLPQNCPTPSNELESFYGAGYIRDQACIEYVNKIPRCQVTLSPPVNVSGACQNFLITYLNYNGCVNAHRNDTDFKSKTWRIYLGRTSPMWRTKNELVKLLDINGKTVDAFSY
ncbi:hypothetical protein CO131_00275 [Candidatus Kaiserbacteria bacterium CG_4_9_14_3_um_filter_50_16]|uniref:LTD domain-containing protein n=1 Tax=Candidatus Kaiserbacteria bacterium CG08_land_8_20_14_0_20_50_21 TaxID=1974604 RepID=A0A2H0YXG6_9BACT|nr:MAG: hypothetical protein AUJ45_01555 [Parcubacteria group bacterium CG1_02_50_68]PIS43194.1 MAG: hypothetical protein COT23_02560 [Candidatus Kaiserbacteria bacterium CG08_land_8_20_14_0_20_50_21]PIU82137.1 MAG: hypothetical protein COS69_00830 [Candidatus Kaiserbacteria bacterium CG06_land_8_20_14_3_00_49_31]PJA00450.1 MAG: hypothetical protein COX76_01765 [Candidatus Kaiserbacteria bacterium CG_4_10_14_0_2_um_filter_50_16]PJA94653.1 MAG: hypothetical protein CO131_00275 [Candidatus Kaiser